jgi:hypothetical protein
VTTPQHLTSRLGPSTVFLALLPRCTSGFVALAAAAALGLSIGSTAPELHPTSAASEPGTYSRSIELTAAASSMVQAKASACNESTSYVNSSGNCIHRPETTGSAPSGATAQCADGEYSLSQHHAGTCSGHGGVKQWL